MCYGWYSESDFSENISEFEFIKYFHASMMHRKHISSVMLNIEHQNRGNAQKYPCWVRWGSGIEYQYCNNAQKYPYVELHYRTNKIVSNCLRGQHHICCLGKHWPACNGKDTNVPWYVAIVRVNLSTSAEAERQGGQFTSHAYTTNSNNLY